MESTDTDKSEFLRTLPGDDLRSIMWGYDTRYDLQMLIQSVRSVARGPVASLVAEGGRNTHEWTDKKASLLKAFDDSGLTSLFMSPEQGGYIEGPKNLALAIAAFELAWVDGGSATASLAGNLALEPIFERGTEEQKMAYMSGAVPPGPGEDKKQLRGAFALTEPLPFVGVETGILSGRVSIEKWEEGKVPILKVEKRGRFITNMDFANFACVAVDSGDERIKGSCMIIIEESDPGVFDRGAPTLKLVHQLSSTRDPIFNMQVPAVRIIGGYSIKDGVIVPNFSHGEVIEAVFKRTRVTVGLMTAAKLLSAVEPVIRYQRGRFRGGSLEPDSPRYKLGIQQKEDALYRLASLWAVGEAGAAMGFEAARVFDELEPLEKEKDRIFSERNIEKGRSELRALMKTQKDALEYLELKEKGENSARYEELKKDPLVRYVLVDSVANVICPACKLWNTGQGANFMREAVSLMGGYGITEDCPGFLGHKWMDSQLEATYEGPEAVQRRQLSVTMTNKVFLAQLKSWMSEPGNISKEKGGAGVAVVKNAFEMWLFTLDYLQKNKDKKGMKLYSSSRQGITFPLADALGWLLASKYQISSVLNLINRGQENPAVFEGLEGAINFFSDLCAIQAARAGGEAARILSELFYGCGSDISADEAKAFSDLRETLDKSFEGVFEAKHRAGMSLSQVMIPEALDYPQ